MMSPRSHNSISRTTGGSASRTAGASFDTRLRELLALLIHVGKWRCTQPRQNWPLLPPLQFLSGTRARLATARQRKATSTRRAHRHTPAKPRSGSTYRKMNANLCLPPTRSTVRSSRDEACDRSRRRPQLVEPQRRDPLMVLRRTASPTAVARGLRDSRDTLNFLTRLIRLDHVTLAPDPRHVSRFSSGFAAPLTFPPTYLLHLEHEMRAVHTTPSQPAPYLRHTLGTSATIRVSGATTSPAPSGRGPCGRRASSSPVSKRSPAPPYILAPMTVRTAPRPGRRQTNEVANDLSFELRVVPKSPAPP